MSDLSIRKLSQKRFAIALTVVCLFWYGSDARAKTAICETATSERWFSPPQHNLADKAPQQCQSCEHPDNAQTAECVVYRTLRSEECLLGRCTTEQGDFWVSADQGLAIQKSLRYLKPWKFLFDIGTNCWFLLWATDPVIGVEHAHERDAKDYWRRAYEAAATRVHPPIPDIELAMLIQPANRRSQHQLHIHIGRLDPAYREYLDQLIASPDKTYKQEINGYEFHVRYLPDLPGLAPLQGHAVFERVAQMIPGNESSMPLYGVLVARHRNAVGSWIMAARGLVRDELVFSTQHTCQLEDSVRSDQPQN